MKILKSVEVLAEEVFNKYHENKDNILVLLIGGYSRSGKSMCAAKLSELLAEKKLSSQIISLDSWLIDIEKREMHSTVIERYDTYAIINSIKKIISGGEIFPPIYDPKSRKRISEFSENPININSGVLIVEGVIALALKDLIDISMIRVFIEISGCLRIKRMIVFYSLLKKISKSEYKAIILSREKEEIPFIKKTSENATVYFYSETNNTFLY